MEQLLSGDLGETSIMILVLVLISVFGALLLLHALKMPPSFDKHEADRKKLKRRMTPEQSDTHIATREETVLDQMGDTKP